MSLIELTDDEAAMLNWFQEFQATKFDEEDETVKSLIEKSTLFVSSGKVFTTANGLKWLNDHSRFFN